MYGQVRGLSWADLIAYDPIGGSLVWTVRRGFTKPGSVAGCVVNGYYYVTYNGKRYRGDLIAWEVMTGVKRRKPVTFANGDRTDLRWSNICGKRDSSGPDVDIGMSVAESGIVIMWFERGAMVRSQTVASAAKANEIITAWVNANVQH